MEHIKPDLETGQRREPGGGKKARRDTVFTGI